ncbi:hypothetical protein ACYFX5_11880 [Bremerella sp. T1]|uniref:hypothetical protein n=1 Tax=Bremerella sp. TYQ1 TaxID=3119568 RepID=UPI001CCED290|nr:hypothetical protein [Bremerella volcania]UBM33771.1 hypothetical protein LA756_13825 [Bremerella volcania]
MKANKVAAYYKAIFVAVSVFASAILLASLARYDQAIVTFSSDETYVGLLYRHLLENGNVRDFALSNTSYLFPDVLIHALSLNLFSDELTAQIGYGAISLTILFTCMLPWFQDIENSFSEADSRTSQRSLLPVFAVIACAFLVIGWQGVIATPLRTTGYQLDSFSLFFCPAHHVGAAIVGFLVLLLVRRVYFSARGTSLLTLLGIFALTFSTFASDALALPWWIASIAAASLLFMRDADLRTKAAQVLGVLILGVLLGAVVSRLLRNMAIPYDPGMSINLSLENALMQIGRLWGYYSHVTIHSPAIIVINLGAMLSAWHLWQSKSIEARFVSRVYVCSFLLSNMAVLVGPVYITTRLFIGVDCLALLLFGMGAFSLALGVSQDRTKWLICPFLMTGCMYAASMVYVSNLEPLPEDASTNEDFIALLDFLEESGLTVGVSHLYDAKRLTYVSGGKISVTPLRCYQPFSPSCALVHPGRGEMQFIVTRRSGILGHPVDHLDADLLEKCFGQPTHSLDVGMYSVRGFEGNDEFARTFKPKILREAGEKIELFPIQLTFPDLAKGVLNADEEVLDAKSNEATREILVMVENVWLNDGKYKLTIDKEHSGASISIDIIGVKGTTSYLAATKNLDPAEDIFEFEFDGPFENATRVVVNILSNGSVEAKIRKITIERNGDLKIQD